MTDTTDMKSAIQRIADRQQLTELYASYCFGLDYDDNQRVLDCFTADGVFSMSDRDRFAGHDEIQGILDASAATRHRHHMVNVLVDQVDGDTAKTRAYFIMLHRSDGRITAWGYSDDQAVRCEDGRWRWTLKQVRFQWRSDD